MGPIANQPQYEKVLGYLDKAKAEGATAACGGEAAGDLGGFFVRPTLFTGSSSTTRWSARRSSAPSRRR
jgi:aldehyde dehydrogenase (NAD+)